MHHRSPSTWILILGGAVAVVIVLGVVWAIAPEDVRGLLMLAGGAMTVALYLALYAVERHRHWGA